MDETPNIENGCRNGEPTERRLSRMPFAGHASMIAPSFKYVSPFAEQGEIIPESKRIPWGPGITTCTRWELWEAYERDEDAMLRSLGINPDDVSNEGEDPINSFPQ